MMELQEIMTAISTLGFPIVISCILLYMLDKNNKEHREEISGLQEAITNNTLVLNRILEHFTDN